MGDSVQGETWDDVEKEKKVAQWKESAQTEGTGEAESGSSATAGGEAEPDSESSLRFTVPKPLASLWLGKVTRRVGKETKTFEGLRGFSSEELTLLAKKELAIGTQESAFIDAADKLIMLAGYGPKMSDANPTVGEEVAESVEHALEDAEAAATGVENIGLPLAKLGLLATGYPFPAHNALQKFKAGVWVLKVTNWLWGAFKSGRNLLGHEKEGVLGLFASNEVVHGAKNSVVSFAGESYGAFAGKAAEVMGGYSAELVGGLFAEVLSGGIAELKGGVSAEVIGGYEAALKSIRGTAEVRGKAVEIGSRSGGWTIGQKATGHVEIESTEKIELSVGPERTTANPAPATTASLDLHGTTIAVHATDVEVHSKLSVTRANAVLKVEDDAVTCTVPVAALPVGALQAAIAAAEAAFQAAKAVAEAAPGLGEGAERNALDAARQVRDDQIAAARRAYDTAIEAAERMPFQPQLEVNSDGVTLSVLTNKIELKKDGTVLITQGPGTQIEMKGAAITLESAQMLTIKACANTWTFGPTGLTGPGVAGA